MALVLKPRKGPCYGFMTAMGCQCSVSPDHWSCPESVVMSLSSMLMVRELRECVSARSHGATAAAHCIKNCHKMALYPAMMG